MAHPRGLPPVDAELAALQQRRDALRQAATLPGAKLRPTLEAALAELDAAVEALAALRGGGGDDTASAAHAERRLLRAMFADAPVPLFLLERDGTVRRANRAAGELLGTGAGYATGKPFTAFVNLPSRAAVHTQLAAAIRTGSPARIRGELLTGGGPRETDLIVALTSLRGDADRLIVAASAAPPAGGRQPGPAPSAAPHAEPGPIEAVTRRLDLVTAVSRLLLDNATENEAVTVQRLAQLLAGELASWVIVDTERDGSLHRQAVAGPEDQRSAELAAEAAASGPEPGSLPHTVWATGSSQLIAHAGDASLLGDGPGEVPLLMLLGTTSVLSVPLGAGEHSYGALTLARQAGEGHFELADLALAEEFGEQLAVAVRIGRLIRRHAQVNEALRVSLLPSVLPEVAGAEVAAVHLAAGGPALGGDFYDVYRAPGGWGMSIGDVGGQGEGVAAVGAAARHAIRALAHSVADPAAVLAGVNEIISADEFGGRFVTVCAAHVRWDRHTLAVTLACAGHPRPVLARRDGSVHQLRGGGLPLGIFAEAGISSETCQLSPGDTLVFFTDGLPDARGSGPGYFGDRVTAEVAALAGQPADRLATRLREAAQEFCGGRCRDDITVLALRAGEPPR